HMQLSSMRTTVVANVVDVATVHHLGSDDQSRRSRLARVVASSGVAEGSGSGDSERTQVAEALSTARRATSLARAAGDVGIGASRARIEVGAEAGDASWWTAWITRSRPCRRRR
ncbi:hypothetical protein ACLOJK_037002, partial [Asimina triloba]